MYFGLGLSEAHLGAPSEVYLGLVTDLDSLTEVYLGLVETDLPLNDVYFGLYIVDSVRGSLGYPNSVVSHSALWILTWPFN